MSDELNKTVDELEQEVLDTLENPYKPYRIVNPYEVRFTLPDDGHRTEVIVRIRSEEVRFGRNIKDVLLQKEVDNRYGKKTYGKHILEWIKNHMGNVDIDEMDIEYTSDPTAVLMTNDDIQEFIETTGGVDD